MRVFKFLECFELDTNIVIYDKESRDVLFQGCVADVPFRVCSQRKIVPNAKISEGTLVLEICKNTSNATD